MKALSRFWQVLVIIFKGIVALWKKIQAYRALRAQQKKEASEPAEELAESPEVAATPEISPTLEDAGVIAALEEVVSASEVTVAQVSERTDDLSPADEERTADEEINLAPEPESAASDVQPTAVQAPKPELVASDVELNEVQQTEIPLPETDLPLPENGRWVPPGEAIKIRFYLLPDGMIYRGQRLNALGDDTQQDLCLINPRLKIVAVEGEARERVLQELWGGSEPLSYKALTPEMRSLYLDWLATGRKSQDIPAEAVLLFLYGIERRVLELLQGEKSVEELLALILELERLASQYPHHESVMGNIQQLIECCQVQLALTCQPETLLALLPGDNKLSVALKVALGRCLEQSKPIPMALLWAWYQSSSVAVDLKTPAKRCESEFNFLLQTRGEQRNFSIVLGENPARTVLTYEPFHPSFGQEPAPIEILETLEISGLEPQLTCFEPLIDECTQELSAYSRLIGRSPEAAGTLAAVALLPQDLVSLVGDESVKGLARWFETQLESDAKVLCAGEELLAQWPTKDPEKIRKKEAELLAILLAKLGYGYTPDVRYGLGTFNPKHSVVLFRLPEAGVEETSTDFALALLALELQPFIGSQAGIQGLIPDHFSLSLGEQQRLAAILRWRQERPITWRQYLGRLKKLDAESLERLGQFVELEALAHSLDDKKYGEIQSLLNLNDLEILNYRALPTPEVEPEPIAPLEPEELEIEEQEAAPVFVLDTALIAQRSQESQVASGLLDDIFTEEEEAAPLPEPETEMAVAESPEPKVISEEMSLGLDNFHWHLVHHLGKKESWEREELEAIAQEQGLLLDGALENINDAAFDHCDEALTEGEDPIEINDWVYEELKAA